MNPNTENSKNIIKSTSLKPLKQKIGKLLNRGYTNIRLTDEALKTINESKQVLNSNSLARTLVSKKLCRVIPKKRRTYKIYPVKKNKLLKYFQKLSPQKTKEELELKVQEIKKRKNVYKPLTSLNYLTKRKILTSKRIWMQKVREQRKILKENKTELKKRGQYKLYRLKVKGNFFKRSTVLLKSIKK